MPHRVHFFTTTLGYILEGTLLTLGSMLAWAHYVANAVIDKDVMDQIRGADGALVGAVLIVVVLWLSKIKDGKRMDTRHDEMIKTMKEATTENNKLVVESIKANAKVAHSINNLVHELSSRPCNVNRPLTPINFDSEIEP